MNKHTPGPWVVSGKILSGSENDKGFRILTVSGSGWRWIADSSPVIKTERGDASAEGEANARLIAAAPELLDACRAALGAFENNNAIDWSELSRAIAKATGDAA